MRERATLAALERLAGAQTLEQRAARRRAAEAAGRARLRAEAAQTAQAELDTVLNDWRRAFEALRLDPLTLAARQEAIADKLHALTRADERLKAAEREADMHIGLAARADARVLLNQRTRQRLNRRLQQRAEDNATQNFIEQISRGKRWP